MTMMRSRRTVGLVVGVVLGIGIADAAPARGHCDVVAGRWTSRDPSRYSDDLNAYLYLKSRPTVIADPSGRSIIRDSVIVLYRRLRCWSHCCVEFNCLTIEGLGICTVLCAHITPPLHCPPTSDRNGQGCPNEDPGVGPKLTSDGWCREGWIPFHRAAFHCYRGYGMHGGKQCCYDARGCLIPDRAPGAGTADIVGPAVGEDNNGYCKNGVLRIIGHGIVDVGVVWGLGNILDWLERHKWQPPCPL